MKTDRQFTAFAGHSFVASGSPKTIILETKQYLDNGGNETVLVFEDETGKQVDFDFHGTPEEVLMKLSSHPLLVDAKTTSKKRSGPGRPKLGVVSREVSLLPRHWEWLEQQPNGISATIRKLVEEAKKRNIDGERSRQQINAAGSFMWSIAGNFPNFEEASRALYAGQFDILKEMIRAWPKDIQAYILHFVETHPEIQ